MYNHPLSPMLEPKSIALVGATAREGSFGLATLRNLSHAGYGGTVYPVNPRYDRIDELDCYPSLSEVPEHVDLAVLSVANARIEDALIEAVRAGARSVTMFGSTYLESDTREPPLRERLRAIAREAGLLVCGANCMGFVNAICGVRATWINVEQHCFFDPGHIAMISHSGTCFLSLQFVDPRYRHNLCVSSGQELTVNVADYMDYALDQESTRVIALFLEAVREPDAFRAALDRAAAQDVPVVAIKVGRTEMSARLAQSHSGALAGNDAVFDALFDHHGVLRVETWDELAAASLLFSQGKRIASGGVSGVMDSGGARGMLIDLADRMGVPLSDIGPDTVRKLAGLLEYGLEPVNPTDVWGSGIEWQNVYTGCMQALVDDTDSCLATIFADVCLPGDYGPELLELAEQVDRNTDKPVFLCQHWSRSVNHEAISVAARSPVPVFDGTRTFLNAVRLAMQRRDRIEDSPADRIEPVSDKIVGKWRQRLMTGRPFDEADGLALLADYRIDVPPHRVVESADDAVTYAQEIGFPVVLKTAVAGIGHKTDVGGVKVGITDIAQLQAACEDMQERLGPRFMVSGMVESGFELAAGIVSDADFGPFIMIGAGGTFVEVLRDRAFLLPPVGRQGALRALNRLECRPCLDGIRGAPPANIEAVCETLTRIAHIAETLGDLISELDVNPLICGAENCVAVDALVIPAEMSRQERIPEHRTGVSNAAEEGAPT